MPGVLLEGQQSIKTRQLHHAMVFFCVRLIATCSKFAMHDRLSDLPLAHQFGEAITLIMEYDKNVVVGLEPSRYVVPSASNLKGRDG